MSKRIERLLRIVSEMRSLEDGSTAQQKQDLSPMSDELSDAELDQVAAASQIPMSPDFLKEKP